MKWVVGVSGASGAIYAKRLLRFLSEKAKTDKTLRIDIVATKNGEAIYRTETGGTLEEFPFKIWKNSDFNAPFASGSAQYDGLAIVPCSGGALGRIASGASSDLLTRTAEVMLKERRKLLIVLRESPLNLIHIKNMEILTLAGAVIIPASPSFYGGEKTAEELADTVVARILDHIGISNNLTKRWNP